MKFPFLISLFVLVFFGLIKFSLPSYFLSDNNANYFVGNYLYNYQSLKEYGLFAQINWYQALGNLHHAQGQTGVFYPFIYLAFGIADLVLGKPLLGIDVLTLIHWWLAGLGVYGFLTYQKKVETNLAFLASLVWITSPFLVGVGRNWIVVTILMGLLPFQNWSLELIKAKPNKFNQIFFITAHLFLILQGYIQWVLMVGLFEVLFLYFQRGEKKTILDLVWSNLVWVKLWLITGLLGSLVWLPLYLNVQNSVARGQVIEITDFIQNSIDIKPWLMAQFGQFSDEVYFNGSSFVLFSSVFWIGLGFIYLTFKNSKVNFKDSSVYAKLGLIGALCTTQLYLIAYQIPVLNWFRWPFKYYPFAIFFLIIWLSLLANKLAKIQRQKFLIFGILIVGLIGQIFVVLDNTAHELAFAPERLSSDYQLSWKQIYQQDPMRVFVFGVDVLDTTDPAQLASHNYSSINQIQFFGGYDATLNLQLWQTIKGLPAFGYMGNTLDTDTIKYLRSWGVGYYLTSNSEAASDLIATNPDFESVYQNQVFLIKDNSQVVSNVFWENDLEAIDYEFVPNGLNIYPESTKSGEIVLNIFDWGKYQAFDTQTGKSLEILSHQNRPIINLEIPTKEIQLRYQDPGIKIAFWLSLIGFIILIADFKFDLLNTKKYK